MPIYKADSEKTAVMREKIGKSQLHNLRLLAETVQKRFARYEIGAPQAVVLVALCARDDMEPAQIADRVLIPRQTVTSILDKLETAGLVVRTDHPSDRRRKIIRLTQAGYDLGCSIWNDLDTYETRVMEAFTPREIELFRRLNMKLAGRIAELDAEG